MYFRTLSSRAAVLALVLVCVLPAGRALAEPEAPVIQAPTSGSTECFVGGTDGAVTVSGTATVGGGETLTIRVYEDVEGVPTQIADGVAITDGAWTTEIVFADGAHQIFARSYDSTGDVPSPESDHVSFTVDAEVRITGASRAPAAISPANADGVKDSATTTATAGTAGTLRFRVFDGATLVRTSPAFAVGAGDDASWTWNGKASGGSYVSSGVYTVRAFWTAAGCPEETADLSVTVDNLRPNVSSHGVLPRTFYPREDDDLTEFKDVTALKYAGLTEPAGLRLRVYRHDGTRVLRTITRSDGDGGAGSVTWNGRDSEARLLPEGRYDLALQLRDAVGNARTLARRVVRLSHDVLAARTATISKVAQNSLGWSSNSSCAQGYESLRYPRGVLLEMSDCSVDTEVIVIVTNFSVPGAAHYEWVRAAAYGRSTEGNHLFAMVYDYGAGEWKQAGFDGPAEGQHWFNRKRGPGFVRDDGRVRVTYFIGDEFATNDYDIRDTTLRVRYGVLVG